MDHAAVDAFADLARALTEHLLDGDAHSLQERVEGLGELLPSLWLAGRRFPSVPALPDPSPGPGADGWPGLGRFDEVDDGPTPSERLARVEAWLWSGLAYHQEGDRAGALTVWASGYPTWSTELVALLPTLHAAALRFRPAPTRPRERAAPTTPTLVGAAPSTDAGPAVPAPAPAVRAALGVRFEAIGLGAWVQEVHPGAPAAAHLQPGDVVLAVDGASLEHVDPHVLAERMVGPVGQARRYQVYRDGETFTAVFGAVALAELMGE